MAPIGIAIAGSGIWVKDHHLPAVLACPDLALKAIYSRTLKSASAAADRIPTLQAGADSPATPDLYASDAGPGKSYADLLAREDIKAVLVCVPIADSPALAKPALAAGKHVFAEKPIAADVARARELIEYWEGVKREAGKEGVMLAVAENFRFFKSFEYALRESEKLGALNGFVVQANMIFKEDSIWLTTGWRTSPAHQGGFILDTGVHWAAALRLILGKNNAIDTVTAYTSLVRPHLAPLDNLHSIARTKKGVLGTLTISNGLNLPPTSFAFSFEKGSIVVDLATVTVMTVDEDGDEVKETEEFEETSFGVREEVFAWAETLVKGKENALQDPREALADLELMEKLLTSGEQNGAPQKLKYQ